MINDSTILEFIAELYLSSRDFNGLPVGKLQNQFSLDSAAVTGLLERLIASEDIDIVFSSHVENPHIKAFPSFPPEKQLAYLKKIGLSEVVCTYPSKKYLASLNLEARFEGQPFTLKLARGSGQLEYRAFDLTVLEYYRNDPRYHYDTDFINGFISVTDEYFESQSMADHDQVLLETFGFAFDADLNRAVAVFIRYLANLSPEHQRIWHAKMLSGDYKLHPDYFRNSILGEWGRKLSIFEAFTMELELINKMSILIGKPTLFKSSFNPKRPLDFGFLLRPTLAEFNNFILLLDKMLSDNIDKNFFINDIDLEEDNQREDGKIEVRQKGTIRLLEEWLGKFFHPEDTEPLQQMFKAIRKIRQLRQKPAHAVNENSFDQKFIKEQRELIIEAYFAVRTLRQALSNHPRVQRNPPDIDEQLINGDIWDR